MAKKAYFKISDSATVEIKNIIGGKNIPSDYGLRIGVNGAGCAGVRQFIGFDKKKEEDDIFEVNDITVYIEKKHAVYLIGIILDFVEENDARGFVFR